MPFSRRFFIRQGALITWAILADGARAVSVPMEKLCDADGVPAKRLREIFLLECSVAGTSHVPAIKARARRLRQGTLLGFKREPENPHDALAILILNPKGKKLGYVPREKNEILARLMDGGKLLFAAVEALQWRGEWLDMRVRVYLGEPDDFCADA